MIEKSRNIHTSITFMNLRLKIVAHIFSQGTQDKITSQKSLRTGTQYSAKESNPIFRESSHITIVCIFRKVYLYCSRGK